MSELYEQALFWINAVWRRRWAALAVTWFVCALGWFIVASKPDTYTATARIFIDSASVLQPLLRGLAVERDVAAEVQVMKETIRNRLNMERVARLTDLDLEATTPLEMQQLIGSLRARTRINTDGYIFTISFTDTQPVRARDVAQALSTVFIEQNLGEKSEEIENARFFLDQQITNYEKQLEEAENELAAFKVERLGILPDPRTASLQLEQQRADLRETESSLKHALVTLETLRRQASAAQASSLSLDIIDLQKQLDDARLRFTEQHPTIITLNRQLAALNARRETELQGQGGDGQLSGLLRNGSGNNGHGDSQNALAEAEANVAVLQDRAELLRTQGERLAVQIAAIPVAEAELARLNRDYDVLRSKHSELVGRREQAILSQQKEAGADRLQFRLVEPPRVPVTANGPSRKIMLTAVLVFALGAGTAFAMFLSVINETFTDAAKLRKVFQLPILGTVSTVKTKTQQTMALAGRSTFAGLLGCLVLVYALLVLNVADVQRIAGISSPFFEDIVLRIGTLLGA